MTIRGYWPTLTEVESLEAELDELAAGLSPGFTVLVDAREWKPPPPEVRAVQKRVMQKLMAAGLAHRAEVVPRSAIARLSTARLSRESGVKALSKEFGDPAAAEEWLDS